MVVLRFRSIHIVVVGKRFVKSNSCVHTPPPPMALENSPGIRKPNVQTCFLGSVWGAIVHCHPHPPVNPDRGRVYARRSRVIVVGSEAGDEVEGFI